METGFNWKKWSIIGGSVIGVCAVFYGVFKLWGHIKKDKPAKAADEKVEEKADKKAEKKAA